MNDSKISVRYAKALFESASEKGVIGEIKTDVEQLDAMIKTVPELTMLLESPVLKSSRKLQIMNQILQIQD